MQPFIYQSTTKIIFGEGLASSTADILSEMGAEKTFIVTDSNLVKAGLLKPVLDSFAGGQYQQPIVYDNVPMDSDIDSVNEAAAIARKAGCNAVLAVGGGSVMDTAKAVNICLTFGGELLQYQGLNNLPRKLNPMLAIPTTSGTGSEVSFVAMIKDHGEGEKLLFGSPYIAPDTALLDPNMLLSLPSKLTAATGIDALTHAIECFVATTTISPITDALCLESMRMLFNWLERATVDGSDLEARSQTLVASTMAGLAFTNAGVGIVHALAHVTGARFNTHHGVTNGVFLPHGMEFNLEAVADRYANAARYVGVSKSGDDKVAAKDFIQAVRNLINVCNLPTRLKELGIPEFESNDKQELALLAQTDAAIMFNPRESSLEDIIGIYERAY